jgi:hypothetical protein
VPRAGRKSDEHNSGAIHVSHKGKPARIFVFGEQDSVLLVARLHQFRIHGTLPEFADRHCKVAILVGEKAHLESILSKEVGRRMAGRI